MLKQIPCNDISKKVKLKNVCILPVCMCTYCATLLINSLGHTLSNDFIETTFYGRTLSSFSSVERTCVAKFFLRWPNEHVTKKLLYRSKSTNYQPRK